MNSPESNTGLNDRLASNYRHHYGNNSKEPYTWHDFVLIIFLFEDEQVPLLRLVFRYNENERYSEIIVWSVDKTYVCNVILPRYNEQRNQVS